ncbi:MAG: HU family DNA-binding protein [Christensenellales bacterium]|jgi:DNA-binding protein HU-beta
MTYSELLRALSEKTGLTRIQCGDFLSGLTDTVIETVASGEKVVLRRLGTFVPKRKAARLWKHPKTGQHVTIREGLTPGFTPSKAFRKRMRGDSDETA